MDEKRFKEAFSLLRASERSKKEIIEMTEDNRYKEQRHGRSGILRAALICAAVAVVLAVSALASEYLGGWEKTWYGDENDVKRGEFEYGRVVENETPENSAGVMVEIPAIEHASDMDITEDGRVLIYGFAALGTETLFDRIIDVTDDLAASEDGTFTCVYETEDFKAAYTVCAPDSARGRRLSEKYKTDGKYWLVTDSSIYLQGSGSWNDFHAEISENKAVFYKYGSDNDVFNDGTCPVYVPAEWQREPTVTGFGYEYREV